MFILLRKPYVEIDPKGSCISFFELFWDLAGSTQCPKKILLHLLRPVAGGLESGQPLFPLLVGFPAVGRFATVAQAGGPLSGQDFGKTTLSLFFDRLSLPNLLLFFSFFGVDDFWNTN
ncbi:MAG: hypothetical protein ACNI3A_16575 [Desulfovibrio sp.]|uniref:hypothetical protein n=1 Tax=Desulfovibrio sp. 7SRBS1 TaxID=3378064 RepID=UPI003B424DE9